MNFIGCFFNTVHRCILFAYTGTDWDQLNTCPGTQSDYRGNRTVVNGTCRVYEHWRLYRRHYVGAFGCSFLDRITGRRLYGGSVWIHHWYTYPASGRRLPGYGYDRICRNNTGLFLEFRTGWQGGGLFRHSRQHYLFYGLDSSYSSHLPECPAA